MATHESEYLLKKLLAIWICFLVALHIVCLFFEWVDSPCQLLKTPPMLLL